MAEIKMVRADFRLIHGQVITKWLRQTPANEILIIDDLLSQDEFMSSIYVMAAPSGIEVRILSVNEAIREWNENQLGNGKLFILIKDIDTIYRTINGGVPIDELQIGGLGSAPGRVNVFGPISFDENDVEKLTELNEKGCYIYLHQVPDEPKLDFQKAKERFEKSNKVKSKSKKVL